MKTAFVTFIYPGASIFFEAFMKSLENQTTHEFTLVVFNDRCEKGELNILGSNAFFNIEIVQNSQSSIAKTRSTAFEYLSKSKYDKFIFGDIDDTFSTTRIQKINQILNSETVVFNELNIVDLNYELLQPKIIQAYLQHKNYVTFEMIKRENLIGFSHLAITKEVMDYLANQQIDERIHIVDWMVISKLLLKWNAYFESDTFTNYVFHEKNIALEANLSIEVIIKEIDIKMKHYEEFSKLDSWYINESKFLKRILTYIEKNSNLKEEVLLLSKKEKIINYPWWSNLKDREELENELQIRKYSKF